MRFNPAEAIAQLATENGHTVVRFTDGPFPVRPDGKYIIVLLNKHGGNNYLIIDGEEIWLDRQATLFLFSAPHAPDYIFNLAEPDSLDRLGKVLKGLA